MLSCKETGWGHEDWEREKNEWKMNPQAPLARSRLEAKTATQVPPPEEILQADFKEVKGTSHSLRQQKYRRPFRGRFRSCTQRTHWSDMGQGEQGESPPCDALCYFLTSIFHVQLSNGHWEVSTPLRSFDPRKKKVRENSSIESQEKDFHRNCIFSLIVCMGKASLSERDLAVQVY